MEASAAQSGGNWVKAVCHGVVCHDNDACGFEACGRVRRELLVRGRRGGVVVGLAVREAGGTATRHGCLASCSQASRACAAAARGQPIRSAGRVGGAAAQSRACRRACITLLLREYPPSPALCCSPAAVMGAAAAADAVRLTPDYPSICLPQHILTTPHVHCAANACSGGTACLSVRRLLRHWLQCKVRGRPALAPRHNAVRACQPPTHAPGLPDQAP